MIHHGMVGVEGWIVREKMNFFFFFDGSSVSARVGGDEFNRVGFTE
jgi:hypothetical protein